MNFKALLFFLVCFSVCGAESSQEKGSTTMQIIELDAYDVLSKPDNQMSYTALADKIIVRIRNIPPSRYNEFEVYTAMFAGVTPPLNGPASWPIKDAKGGVTCGYEQQYNNLVETKKIKDFNKVIKTLKDAMANLPDEQVKACEKLEADAEDALSKTIKEWEITPRDGDRIVISVYVNKEIEYETTLSPQKSRWLTHVGFSFVDNKGKSYYSEKVTKGEDVSYQIALQNSEHSTLYSATGLWTYVLVDNEHVDWGWTAGLGVNNQSIFVLTGPSVVIGDNFLINVGVVAQEFDQLKGNYKLGESLGDSAIDSPNLVDKTIKTAFGVTVGFRFGD